MYRCLLVSIADAATHHRNALRLQPAEQHLLSNAVGLQSLTVHIEGDLLFLLAIKAYIGHRWYAAQLVAQLVGVTLQLPIAALRALDGDEQCRGITEIIVGYKCQHTTWQTLLEKCQSVFDFTPHLIFIVHLVVQPDHHQAHTVLGGCRSFLTVYLSVSEQITLQRPCHLFLHFLGSSARIDSNDNPLANGKRRELVFWHDVHAIDAQRKKNDDNQKRYRIMFEGPFQPIYLLLHH